MEAKEVRTTLVVNLYKVVYVHGGIKETNYVNVRTDYAATVAFIPFSKGYLHWYKIYVEYCKLQAKKHIRGLYEGAVVIEVEKVTL